MFWDGCRSIQQKVWEGKRDDLPSWSGRPNDRAERGRGGYLGSTTDLIRAEKEKEEGDDHKGLPATLKSSSRKSPRENAFRKRIVGGGSGGGP